MEFWTTLLIAFIGSSGILGLLFGLLKHYIENKIKIAECAKKKHSDAQRKRYQYNDEYIHAIGKTLFWIERGLRKFDKTEEYFNGAFTEAYTSMLEKENALTQLDREQLAEINKE